MYNLVALPSSTQIIVLAHLENSIFGLDNTSRFLGCAASVNIHSKFIYRCGQARAFKNMGVARLRGGVLYA